MPPSRTRKQSAPRRASTSKPSSRACSPSRSRTRCGRTPSVAPSPSRRAARTQPMQPKPSASVCRASASPAPSRSSAPSDSVTATLRQCFCVRRPSASHSSPDTSLSRRRRAPSASPRRQTRCANSPSKSSSTGSERTRRTSSAASTVSPMCRPRWTTTPVKSRS